ncbi:MAG: YihY/virulence factor BrkB family protein [Alphaproteobacteria bacterium]
MDEEPAPRESRGLVAAVGHGLLEALQRFLANDGHVVAGHLAFFGLLSLFPFLIFLTALAGFFGQTELGIEFVVFLLDSIPEDVSDVLSVPIIEVVQDTRGELLTIGILLSLWTASTGLEAIRGALDRAYGVTRRRPHWRNRLESVLLVVVAASCFIVAMLTLIVGPIVWAEMEAMLRLPEGLRVVWTLLRYAAGALLIVLAVSALYFLLPARRLGGRGVFPGAFAVLVLWLLAATAFSLYLEQFGDYTVTYGSLGGIIVTLFFFYILAVIFVLGAEINAMVLRRYGAD